VPSCATAAAILWTVDFVVVVVVCCEVVVFVSHYLCIYNMYMLLVVLTTSNEVSIDLLGFNYVMTSIG
jgi:hypothetical protein